MIEPLYLLDSNICIYILEGADERLNLRKRVSDCHPGSVVISAITAAEVLRGRTGEVGGGDHWVSFVSVFPVVPFDMAAAQHFPAVPFRRGSFDRLIAAHALALNVTLVTANVRDFADIPGLSVEDWTL